eukprot:TRINITY_DN554_c7_g1_i1.p1 TRINITY_DN554_c7_g1~~TRINITY_DN554_c7_g1_i1.p1  ORF type:complete len:522 (-),score=121.45 TRINITY_DN554_c7_g1_i1:264-1829(-)
MPNTSCSIVLVLVVVVAIVACARDTHSRTTATTTTINDEGNQNQEKKSRHAHQDNAHNNVLNEHLGGMRLDADAIEGGQLMAGVAKVDGTLPIGTPLAGYNYPPRRPDDWPMPHPKEYTTFMNPSVGAYNPTWVKALYVQTANTSVCFVTLDAIGADGTIAELAYNLAVADGFPLPFEQVIMSAAHTHSGPGGISPAFLWSIAPATDLMVPTLQRTFAQSIADAMVQAFQNLEPALIDIGTGRLLGATHNRRADISPYVSGGTIDPQVGVIRVDDAQGEPIATVWNFAIHGICYDSPNMNFSSDVMGSVCEFVEDNIGGVAMFVNGDAGDTNPVFSVSCNDGPNFSGGPVIGQEVMNVHARLNPTSEVGLQTAAIHTDFGRTNLNLTLQRLDNCTRGGPLDVCSICEVMHCDENIHLGPAWVEQQPMFSAVRWDIHGNKTLLVSIPGEALVELGWQIYNDTLIDLDFDQVLLFGYTNNHLGYFATPNEYDIGGYESILIFWGRNTSNVVRDYCKQVASMVA